ncbi:MAG: DUF3990 domain-containing protein [Prevotella sp.]|nr:DUF3990 domain-containing protein [Prevotella sp.]MBR1464476.1 DUF3990 domain-containing protein [Prevotella sp.]
MKLYHGSTVDITEINLAKSKPNKDFGKAFYLSDDEQQALEIIHQGHNVPICFLHPESH